MIFSTTSLARPRRDFDRLPLRGSPRHCSRREYHHDASIDWQPIATSHSTASVRRSCRCRLDGSAISLHIDDGRFDGKSVRSQIGQAGRGIRACQRADGNSLARYLAGDRQPRGGIKRQAHVEPFRSFCLPARRQRDNLAVSEACVFPAFADQIEHRAAVGAGLRLCASEQECQHQPIVIRLYLTSSRDSAAPDLRFTADHVPAPLPAARRPACETRPRSFTDDSGRQRQPARHAAAVQLHDSLLFQGPDHGRPGVRGRASAEQQKRGQHQGRTGGDRRGFQPARSCRNRPSETDRATAGVRPRANFPEASSGDMSPLLGDDPIESLQQCRR